MDAGSFGVLPYGFAASRRCLCIFSRSDGWSFLSSCGLVPKDSPDAEVFGVGFGVLFLVESFFAPNRPFSCDAGDGSFSVFGGKALGARVLSASPVVSVYGHRVVGPAGHPADSN